MGVPVFVLEEIGSDLCLVSVCVLLFCSMFDTDQWESKVTEHSSAVCAFP